MRFLFAVAVVAGFVIGIGCKTLSTPSKTMMANMPDQCPDDVGRKIKCLSDQDLNSALISQDDLDCYMCEKASKCVTKSNIYCADHDSMCQECHPSPFHMMEHKMPDAGAQGDQ